MRAVSGELAGEGIYAEYFRAAKVSAVHVEVQDSYQVPDEYEPLVRWRESRDIVETDGGRQWCALVAETAARGVTVARVRVVSVPHTEYTAWLLDACAPNAAAGEQIRYLPRHLATGHIPQDDYWLFDDERVAFNTVDETGDAVGLAVTTDPDIVAVAGAGWRRLWEQGINRADYRLEYAAQ
ncbi:hypothetical protein OG874_37600 [Nocardia sp. NBC_00565]|uniref:DUF6879 family protein n=1 Tax=Nocardia sp. NBC_00565 TaxID=2975993 RepID=UPI002E8122F1|nr:DUF6879 family protein [Nocardia sp. NBC_00565]WUC02382.1 hypothetical protein OG874_37600 [Nocardia sp. NBC_00565]